MSKYPWMPLWVGDFLGDTAHLNAAETGAYLLLLIHLWLNGTLPNDDRKLARIARTTPRQWKAMRDTIVQFFDAGWTHERVTAERMRAAEISAKRRMAVGKRRDRNFTIVSTNVGQSQSHSLKERMANQAAKEKQQLAEREEFEKHRRARQRAPSLSASLDAATPLERYARILICINTERRRQAQAAVWPRRTQCLPPPNPFLRVRCVGVLTSGTRNRRHPRSSYARLSGNWVRLCQHCWLFSRGYRRR